MFKRQDGFGLPVLANDCTFLNGENKMARMYSRKRGTSRSTPPLEKTKPVWLRHSEKEVELLIAKLAKEGNSASKIGLVLRDSYGIPDVSLVINKSISQVLEEKKQTPELPDDMMSLIKRAFKIRKHMETNRHDMTAKRGLQLTESKIKRLAKYYKGTGKVAEEWKYDPKSMRIFTE